MIMGLEYLSHKEKLRVSTVQSGYQKDQRDLIHVVKILMGWRKEDRTRPFKWFPVTGQDRVGMS